MPAGRPHKQKVTLASIMAAEFRAQALALNPPPDDGTAFPTARWRHDIVGFALHHFGIELCDFQKDVLVAVQDRPKVAVSGGRKIGKSVMAAIAALHFYSSYEDARVFLTATAIAQVDDVMWREIQRLVRLAAKRGTPIDGQLSTDPETGLRAADGRQIKAFSLTVQERGSGRSGINILYLFDEASAVPDYVFDIIEGNQAGDGGTMRLFIISNPTRCEGRFYDAFHAHKDFWYTFQISSERSPNVVAGHAIVPGMAGRKWIDEMRKKWGEDNPHFLIHVRGIFVEGEVAAVIKIAEMAAAYERHKTAKGTGVLVIGCDPAGPAVGGDESAFAIRRDPKIERVDRFRGLTPAQHVVMVQGYIREFRPVEDAVVVVDASGEVGWEVLAALRTASFMPLSRFSVVPVRSNLAGRKPREYRAIRDELVAHLVQWIRDGGALPPDRQLDEEMRAFRWRGLKSNQAELNPKTELREKLGRSPDTADAVCLAVWYRAGDSSTGGDGPERIAAPSSDPDDEIGDWPADGIISPY